MAPIRMQSSRQLPLAVAFLLVSTAASFTAPSEFVFAGMFPRAGWDVGEICTASAVIAIDEINLDATLLPNTVLKQYWNDKIVADDSSNFLDASSSFVGQTAGQYITDSQCDPKMSMNVFMQQLMNAKNADPSYEISAIIGPGCSGATLPVAQAAAGLRIPIMSFGASSPKLSDAAAYPWFARMTPSDAEGMDMAADFFNTNSIKKVGFLGDDSGYCTDNFDYFEKKIAPNVRHEGSEIWPQAELTLVQAEALLTRMVEKGIKIFFLCDYTEDDLVLKQAAYNLGLTADDTNFLFAIWPPPEDSISALATSAQTETEKANVRATHEGWVGYNAKFVSSPLKDAYKISLKEKLGNDKYTSWCEYAYDIIYLYAHSIHNLIEAEQQPFGARLKEELKKSAFVGITGPVKLEPNGDRKVDSSLYRLNGAGEKTETFVYDATAGTSTIAAGYIFKGVDTPACEAASNGEACSGQGSCTQKFIGEKTLEKVCSCNAGFAGSKCESACNAANGKADSSGKCLCNSKRWSGSDCGTEVPQDLGLIPGSMKALSLLMFSINVVAGVTGGVWVFMHKTAPVVQMAQPFFLYLLVLGCIVSSATIIPMGVENSDLKDLSAANMGCAIFPWLYSVGFCITFGTLFSKIWRVHKIFSAASKMQRAKVSIGDTLRMIMGLLLIDVVILTIWTTSDPLKWTRTTLTSDVSGYPLSSAGQCESPSSGKYLAALGTLHALVMVYASYLCYQTRNIPTEFAGGKYVALAMASNLQVFLLGVPVMVIVGNDPSTSFFVRSAIIFLNDFAVLAFILGNIVFSFYTQGNKVSADASATSMTSATSKTAMTSKTQLNFGSQNSSEHAVEAVVPTKEVEAVVPAKEVESAIDGPPIVVVQPAEEVQSA